MSHFIHDLRLGKKVLLAPVIVFFFLIVLAIGTYLAISFQTNSIDDIYHKRFKGYQASSKILADMTTVQADLYKLMNWISASHDLRQSRRLDFMNRSKRYDYEPPEGGYSSNIPS